MARPSKDTGNGQSEQAAPVELPVLYHQPRPLNATVDAGKSLDRPKNHLYARGTNSVALTFAEFAQAMRSYPIVFTGGEPVAAMAILGLRDKENLFVDAAGNWQSGAYVPAYIRRYPFIFMQHPDTTDL